MRLIAIVEEHGCAYSLIEGILSCAPLHIDESVDTDIDYWASVSESPEDFKEVHIEAIKALSPDSDVTSIISNIEYL